MARILVACEYSGTVRDAFTRAGHHAVSCDILPTESEGLHYRGDVRDILYSRHWDMIIAHPPCTYLTNSGVRWLSTNEDRWTHLQAGIQFFNLLWTAPADRVCVENPVPHRYARVHIGDYSQTIQPYEYGHPESKRTCLWLRNLPNLQPTNVLTKPARGYWDNQTPSGQNKLAPSPDRWKIRSTFYTGWAQAMADQWGGLL